MDDDRKKLATGIAFGITATLGLALVIGLLVVGKGAYNVAATEGHAATSRWALETTMHNSAERRASRYAEAGPKTPPSKKARRNTRPFAGIVTPAPAPEEPNGRRA